MSTSLLGLVLGLPIVGVPAPKTVGLPAEIIDRLPEDTAAVLVVDVPRVAQSTVGKHFIARLHPQIEEWLPLETIAKEVEFAVLAQYAIEEFAGDFCFLLRLRDGAQLPGKLRKAAQGKAIQIDGHMVYNVRPGAFCGMLDRHTLAFVVLTGAQCGDAALARELGAVFGAGKKGPNESLRRQLTDLKVERALTLLSDHPKSGYSVSLPLVSLGYNMPTLKEWRDKITRYSGGVTIGAGASLEMSIEAKDAAAAAQIRWALEQERSNEADAWVQALRKDMAVTREKGRVTLKARLTREIIDLMWPKE